MKLLCTFLLLLFSVSFANQPVTIITEDSKLRVFDDFKVCFPGDYISKFHVNTNIGLLPVYECEYQRNRWLELRNAEDTKTLRIFEPKER